MIWFGYVIFPKHNYYAVHITIQYKYAHTKQNVTDLETLINTFPDLFRLSRKLEIRFQACLNNHVLSIK